MPIGGRTDQNHQGPLRKPSEIGKIKKGTPHAWARSIHTSPTKFPGRGPAGRAVAWELCGRGMYRAKAWGAPFLILPILYGFLRGP